MNAAGGGGAQQARQLGGPGSALERNLKIAVIAMGVLIVLGVLAVIGRIVWLASRPATGPTPGATALVSSAKLALPAGATVRSVQLSGDRLVVHYDAQTGAGIAILDLTSGRTLSRVELVPELPRQ